MKLRFSTPLVRLRAGSARGVAMVELGFSLAALAVVVVGTVDFARVFYFSMELNAAARAGAQYAGRTSTISSDTSATTLNAIKDAAIAAYSGTTDTHFPLTRSDVTLGDAAVTGNTTSEVPKCAAANGSGTFDDPPGGGTLTCSSPCSNGAKPTKVCYVKVTVTKTFSRVSGFPGVPSSVTVSRSAWWRVQ